MNTKSLTFNLIHFYGCRVPYHRGKGRLIHRMLKILDFHVNKEFDLTYGGLHWRLNPADFMQAELFWMGRTDFYDVYHLQRILKPNCVFFDLGSNFGYYSVVIGSHLGKRCEIHAFEPYPATLLRLRYHVAVNGLQDVVHIHDVAIANRVGTAGLATKEGNSGGTHVVAQEQASTIVQVTTLDAFCDQQRIARIDAIKIDVEGFEERVLLGGWETLKRLQPALLMELEPPRLCEISNRPLNASSIC